MRPSALVGTCVAASLAFFISFSPSHAEDQSGVDTSFATAQLFESLTRAGPWQRFSGTRLVNLTLSDPSKPTPRLEFHLGPLRTKDTRIDVARVALEARQMPVEAGVLPVEIKVSGLRGAGSFELPIQIYRAGSPVQRFAVGLSAGDAVWLPLITILIGVFASFGLRHLTDRYEPRQLLLARTEDLRAETRQLFDLSSSAARRFELQSLLVRLNEVEVKSDAEDLKSLGQEVDKIKAEFDALRAKWILRIDSVAASIKSAKDAIRADRRSVFPIPTSEEVDTLDALAGRLRQVEAALSAGTLDLADEMLEDWTRDLLDLRVRRLRRLYDALDSEASELGPEAVERTADLRSQALSSLAAGDLDATVAILTQISDLVHRNRADVMEMLKEKVGAAPPDATDDPKASGPVLARNRAVEARRRASQARAALSGISAVLAALSGLAALYLGKPFGTGADYLLALIWGFGTDSTVQNADALIRKFKGPST